MKKYSISSTLILTLIFIWSCIDPLEIDIDKEVNILIVEGAITTQPGPHSIRLSRSIKFDGIASSGFIKPIINASVVIRDSDGINYTLKERINIFIDELGITHSSLSGEYYTTDDFSGVVGKSYTLLITTTNGIEYTSLPETITKGSEILKLNAEFIKIPLAKKKFEPGIVKNNKFKSGLELYATFQDNPEEQNFYMWKSSGTYKIITYPKRFTWGIPPVPAPKDCCAVCWVSEINHSLRLLSDNNINGNIITDLAAFIEDDGFRFTDKYFVWIEQHSLTREAFQFFQLLKEQININGDIFDPPPATIRGNMINLSSPDENVIGYFRASDVSVDSIFLTREMLLEKQILPEIPDDCRLVKYGWSIEQPSYW